MYALGTARGVENAKPPANREDLATRVFGSGAGDRGPVEAADFGHVKEASVKRRDSAQSNGCSVKLERQ